MPKIPLYNQGAGPSVQMAAGTLGPRAQSGTFEAPGRALAGFADAAGQVAFNFGMAEKDRENKRIAREEYAQAYDEVTTWIMEDRSTNIEDAQTGFLELQKSITDRVGQKGYKKSTQELVSNSLSKIFLEGGLDAKQQAYKRGVAASATAADADTLAGFETLRKYNPDDPRFKFTEDLLLDSAKTNAEAGLPTTYNQISIQKEIRSIKENNVRSNYADLISSADASQLDKLESGLPDLDLPEPSKNVLRGMVKTRRAELDTELVARFAAYIPIENVGDTDFDTIEALEYLVEGARGGNFGGDTALEAEWETLSQEDKNKVEAAWSNRLTQARNQVSFNENKKNKDERDTNESIYTDSKEKILGGDLSVTQVRNLGFVGVEGEKLREQLVDLVGRRARGELLTDSKPIIYRETTGKLYQGDITSVTQRFVVPSDPPEVRAANDGAGLSILERQGKDFSDNNVAEMERYISASVRQAESSASAQEVKNLSQFEDFVSGYKNVIMGDPVFASLNINSESRFYDFKMQMRERFFRQIEAGKEAKDLLNPRSRDFLIRVDEEWTPSPQTIMREIRASLDATKDIPELADVAPPPRGNRSIEEYLKSDDYLNWATGPKKPIYDNLLRSQQ